MTILKKQGFDKLLQLMFWAIFLGTVYLGISENEEVMDIKEASVELADPLMTN